MMVVGREAWTDGEEAKFNIKREPKEISHARTNQQKIQLAIFSMKSSSATVLVI
jgi:hypothetical protein